MLYGRQDQLRKQNAAWRVFNVKLRKSAMALQNFLKNEELREEPPLYKGSLVSFNVDSWTFAAKV